MNILRFALKRTIFQIPQETTRVFSLQTLFTKDEWIVKHTAGFHTLNNYRCDISTAIPLNPVPLSRGVVMFSKKGKCKTVKAVAKRFKRTGSGALKYWRAGKNHRMLVKSSRASRQLRKPRYVNKTQLKTLNKMLSGI